MGATEGWELVFRGSRVEADVVQAVLEANGLRPIVEERSPQVWWSGSTFEDCLVYVPTEQADDARRVLTTSEDQA